MGILGSLRGTVVVLASQIVMYGVSVRCVGFAKVIDLVDFTIHLVFQAQQASTLVFN